ncbi:MAG: hypothetical protein ACYCX8_10065 [Acidimicrobiales bacterium]|jgi:hypothetical protein
MNENQPPLPFNEQIDARTRSTGTRTGTPAEGPDGPITTDTPRRWRLDEHTRSIGREGVAAARALLLGTRRAA